MRPKRRLSVTTLPSVSVRTAGRGLATSALAAAAAVALTGSQAGGVLIPIEEASTGISQTGVNEPIVAAADPAPLSGIGPDFIPTGDVKQKVAGVFDAGALTRSGIPKRAQQAYVAAARTMARTDPGCNIPWSLLAGIGRVESDHGRFGGAGLTADGVVSPAIIGIRLDGTRAGVARIGDSDGGKYDGDPHFDRAVGPMQFLPGTWRSYGGGGNPQNMEDAAPAAAKYLCAGGGSVGTAQGRWAAVYRYNHSDAYVSRVVALADSYAHGRAVMDLPSRPGGVVTGNGGDSATSGDAPALRSSEKKQKKSSSAAKSGAVKKKSSSSGPKARPTQAPSSPTRKKAPTCTKSGGAGFTYPSDWPTWTVPSDWLSKADQKKAAEKKKAEEAAKKKAAAKKSC